MQRLFTALRTSSATDLAICSAMAFVASAALELGGNRDGEVFFGMLLGLGTGMGLMALAVWRRRRDVG